MRAPKIEYSRHLLLSSVNGDFRKREGYDEEQINNVVKFLYGAELKARKPFAKSDLGVAEFLKDFRGYVCRSCGVNQEEVEKEFGKEYAAAGLGIAGPSMYGESDKLKGQLVERMMDDAGGRSSDAVCYAVRGLFQYLQEEAKRGDEECANMASQMREIFPSNGSMGAFVTSRSDFGVKKSSKFLPMVDVPNDVKEFIEDYRLDLHTRLVRQNPAKSKDAGAPSGKASDARAAAATAISRGWETRFFIR